MFLGACKDISPSPATDSTAGDGADFSGFDISNDTGHSLATIPGFGAEFTDGALILRWAIPQTIGIDRWRLYYRVGLPGPPWDGNNAQNGPSPLDIGVEFTTLTLAGLANDHTVYLWIEGLLTDTPIAHSEIVKATPRRDANAQILVPAGVFWMGSDDVGAPPDESPRHPVYLDAFLIDRYVATNSDYRTCVDADACPLPASASGFVGDLVSVPDYFHNVLYDPWPVVFLGHDAAAAYCVFRGKRLPTEAEWERAARGNSLGLYPWGDFAPNCTLANYADEGVFCVGGPTPVGAYVNPDIALGIADIVGNVWQWTADWYSPLSYQESPCANPSGPMSGTDRVLRGGSWYYDAEALSITHRNHWPPVLDTASAEFGGYFGFGVRCVQDATLVPCDPETAICTLPEECTETPPPDDVVSSDSKGDACGDGTCDINETVDSSPSPDTITADTTPDVGDIVAEDTGAPTCDWVQDNPQDLAACLSTPAPQCPSGWPDACPTKPCFCAVGISTQAPSCGQQQFELTAGWRDLEKQFHAFSSTESMEICEGFQGGIHLTIAFLLVAPTQTEEFFYADIYVRLVIDGVTVAGLAKEIYKFVRNEEGSFESKNQQVRFEGCSGEFYKGKNAELEVLVRTKDGVYGTTKTTIPLKNDLNGPFLDGVNPC